MKITFAKGWHMHYATSAKSVIKAKAKLLTALG